MSLYPLKFRPRLLEKMWGGRKLQTVLGKPLPNEDPFGESWELYDFPPGIIDGSTDWVSSEIANGPLAGRTLHWAIGEFGTELYGDVPLLQPHGQFPVFTKFLDARDDLSIQVHPDENFCREYAGAHLKCESWYVMDADPGSRLFLGLKPGTTREAFREAIATGTVEQHVIAVPVKGGDCYYLPSGTLHALGAGTLVAEVQTPSDTTFRVYDFNRVDPSTGKQRKLHVDEALRCIDFSGKPLPQQRRSHVAGFFTTVSRLVSCDHFKIEKVRFTEGVEEPVPYDEPVVWMMLDGKAEIRTEGAREPTTLGKGDTALLPAEMKRPVLKTHTDCVWLEVTFPTRS